jgi:hypothetical protein
LTTSVKYRTFAGLMLLTYNDEII